MYYLAITVSIRCPCQPPLRFDAADAKSPLINQCRSISAFIVDSKPILGSMGVGKSARTSSTLLVAPTIFSLGLGGIVGRFVPWDNSSNLLNR